MITIKSVRCNGQWRWSLLVAICVCVGAESVAAGVVAGTEWSSCRSGHGVDAMTDGAAPPVDNEDDLVEDDLVPSLDLQLLDGVTRDAFEFATRRGWTQGAAMWYFLATTSQGSRAPRLISVLVSAGFGDRTHAPAAVWTLRSLLRETDQSLELALPRRVMACDGERLSVLVGSDSSSLVPSRDELMMRRGGVMQALRGGRERHLLRAWLIDDTGFFRQLAVVGLADIGGLLPGEVDALVPLLSTDSELRYMVARHFPELVPRSRHRRIVEVLADADDQCAERAAALRLVTANNPSATALALERFGVLREPDTNDDLILASRLRLDLTASADALDPLLDRLLLVGGPVDPIWSRHELQALLLDWAMLDGQHQRARLECIRTLAEVLHAGSRWEVCSWFALAGCIIDPTDESFRALAIAALTTHDRFVRRAGWQLASAISAVPQLADELYAAARSDWVPRIHPVWGPLRTLMELESDGTVVSRPVDSAR